MEISSDSVHSFADDSGAGGAEAAHLDKTISNTPPNEKQGSAGNMQQRPRNPLDDKIDELEQKLAALTASNSPSMSSNASFRTAQEQLSPILLSRKAPKKRKERKVPKTSPRGSRHQSVTAMQSTSPPTTSYGPSTRASTRPSTRRSSTAPTSQVPSASSSKHENRTPPSIHPSTSSSKRIAPNPNFQLPSPSSPNHPTLNHTPQTATRRPNPRARLNNTTWPTLTTVPASRQRLQSVRAFSALQRDVHAALSSPQRLRSTSLPTFPPPTHTNPTPPLEPTPPIIPATTIDWTLPSTRRREYEKIDRARSGLRGWVRRVTPRFARRKGGRMGFHGEEGGSEGGSVRRFRVDVGGGGEGDEGEGNGEGDDGDGERYGVRRRWWKFGIGKGKGKGKSVLGAEGGVGSERGE